jgi:hypothetical protein
MLRQVRENTGDIFGLLPYPVPANIHNIKNLDEAVLGYFEVSAVTEKRMFISPKQLRPMNLPPTKSDCEYIRVAPDEYVSSWNKLYQYWVFDRHYIFVEPETPAIIPDTLSSVKEFIFTNRECAFCEATGFSERPDFWIDSE